MKIYKEFNNAHDRDFIEILNTQTWAGAKTRIELMDEEEFKELLNYIDSIMEFDDENEWSLTQINDFIWFEWDEIYENIKGGQ